MASWYDKAVFYHIYPLGMLGAPFVNTEDAAADRFPELDNGLPTWKPQAAPPFTSDRSLSPPPMATTPGITGL